MKSIEKIAILHNFFVIFHYVHGVSMGISIEPEPVMATYIKS